MILTKRYARTVVRKVGNFYRNAGKCNNKEIIKKIRVSFTNGDIEDWDIDLKYQKKLTEGLSESYNIVETKDTDRKEKIKDVESGF